ncbi:MAG: hypothetical protein AAB599_01935 [Patescibacteria group bacterium]
MTSDELAIRRVIQEVLDSEYPRKRELKGALVSAKTMGLIDLVEQIEHQLAEIERVRRDGREKVKAAKTFIGLAPGTSGTYHHPHYGDIPVTFLAVTRSKLRIQRVNKPRIVHEIDPRCFTPFPS